MARRRRIEAPSQDDLQQIEAELAGGKRARPAIPIAQVAAQSAAEAEPLSAEERAGAARLRADAERLRMAEAAGLILTEIPLAGIDANAMVRDRTVMSDEDMTELRLSIAASGLRMPLEVFALPDPDGPVRYGLLSGYRRLLACRGLLELGREEFRTVKCFVRQPDGVGAAYSAMVEENEVRASLSHFERGRVAVIAAQQGAFTNTEEAVNHLFASASKAKRSKVRSFAVVFEELGDMLIFPEALTEKRGLAVATALRNGAERRFREVLASTTPGDAEAEWGLLDRVIQEMSDAPRDKSRGGRPSTAPAAGWQGPDVLRTSTGYVIRRLADERGVSFRLEGKHLPAELQESLMERIRYLLEAPDTPGE